MAWIMWKFVMFFQLQLSIKSFVRYISVNFEIISSMTLSRNEKLKCNYRITSTTTYCSTRFCIPNVLGMHNDDGWHGTHIVQQLSAPKPGKIVVPWWYLKPITRLMHVCSHCKLGQAAGMLLLLRLSPYPTGIPRKRTSVHYMLNGNTKLGQ